MRSNIQKQRKLDKIIYLSNHHIAGPVGVPLTIYIIILALDTLFVFKYFVITISIALIIISYLWVSGMFKVFTVNNIASVCRYFPVTKKDIRNSKFKSMFHVSIVLSLLSALIICLIPVPFVLINFIVVTILGLIVPNVIGYFYIVKHI